ncbi:MAG: hypothetical protein IIB02_07205 [Thaumarchaeota archaeon]|nr:hypothetical protein [Nitrososphaerota archaeon]
MYNCDECHEDANRSTYSIPVIINSEKENKMLHIECCSKDQLLDRLNKIALSEILFYQDLLKIVENADQGKIKDFTRKYGTHDEHKFGIQIDKFLEALAIIDKLKE